MTPSRRVTLILLFTVSLLAKLGGVAYMNRYLAWNLMAPDTVGSYRPLAISVLAGDGYQLAGDHARATKVAPGFPLYLAGIYKLFGADVPIWWLGVLNALMRAGVTLLVFLLAARAFGPLAGAAAGLIHALDPWEAFWTAFVLKESLAVLLSVLAVLLIVRALDRPTWLRGTLAGLILAAASLTRFATLGLFPWTMLLLAVCGLRGLVPGRSAVRLAGAVTLGVLVGIAPWVARNYLVMGRLTVHTRAEFYFFVSNGPGAERGPDTSGYAGFSGGDLKEIPNLVPRGTPRAKWHATLAEKTAEHLLTHPALAGRLVLSRFINLWRPTFAGSSLSNQALLGVPYCVMMCAAVIGLVLGIGRPRVWPSPAVPASPTAGRDRLVLYWAVSFYVVLHLLFWSEIRYRQYITPFLAAFAGCAVAAVIAAAQRGTLAARPIDERDPAAFDRGNP